MNKRLQHVADSPHPLAFCWTAAHMSALRPNGANTIPGFTREECASRLPGLDIWDMWPVENLEGDAHTFAQGWLWLALAAPALPDPEDRHAIARIHLLLQMIDGSGWVDCGPAFPDGHTPGSREWSGSALYDAADRRVLCWFTAAGRRDETIPTFEQRLFLTEGVLHWLGDRPVIENWTRPEEAVAADGDIYLRVRGSEGGAGTIKAFRDPCYFQDPRSGEHFLFFTASKAASASQWNGVIGVAHSLAGPHGPWRLLPPVVDGDGLNNELERPHMRYIGGLYYLFWSTQRKVFAADGPQGPTGLYGVVGEGPLGPFHPINGDTLVAGNPEETPWQAYSWWVLGDGRVTSFADLPGIAPDAAPADASGRRRAFGGSPAPWFTLRLAGDTSRIQVDSR
ncbi:glycoside hydrolase family 68 protein [Novosphingobium sp. SG707]|uniref:glycoside hydrolase family 68 protein n=1 Tax=Novosphingobium sp. SG707 TaxID=2586996 RepID=UPI0017EF21FD|nr:glycoside hydrolase family 68 protein [Novosphingobium sp. SG707]NKI98464.1 levansucrase [Novosphingobium sp. SG707]